jgi:predicted metalloprotease with PDZ domain
VSWFSEGFTTHYARRALFDAGVIDANAFLQDLHRIASDDADADLRDEATRRGALYAAKLDAAIRKTSDGARSLDDVMRKLLDESTASGGVALPTGALRELVVGELGAASGDDFDRLMLRGEGAIDLPDDAFGPSFERVRSRERFYELGFDRASIDGTPSVLRHLTPGSAADKAGLREGDIVLKAKIPFDLDAKHEIDLTVADHRGSKRIRYQPEGTRDVVRWRTRR